MATTSCSEVLIETRTLVLRLREQPMHAPARALLEQLARVVGVERYGSLESARAAGRRVERARAASAGAPPFVCPGCGETWPGVRADSGPRLACGDPRCSGRAAGLASAARRRARREASERGG